MKFFRFTFILLLLVLAVTVAAENEVTIKATLDRNKIGLDEQATLLVTISGKGRNLPTPMLPTLSAFEVYSQGSSTNLSIVNGKVSASNTYQYILIPSKPGTFPIEQIAIVHNNRRIKANPIQLTVLKEGSSASQRLERQASGADGKAKDYFLEAVIDKKNPYVGEQVTFTLKFYIAIQYYGSPELTEPSTTGFWTEVLGNKAPYYQRLNNRKYKVIERKYALFPTHTGDLTIGKAAIKTTVADRNKRYRDPFDALGDFFGRGKAVTARSKTVRINVKPLPEKGKPVDYSGLVGRFAVDAIVNKRSVEVNQPVSLTITISGNGNIKSAAEPQLSENPDFRVYRASVNEHMSKSNDRIGGRKIYEEVFIPKRPGKLEIPAIKYNYFDPQSGKFRNITTRAIVLNVTKPEGYIASPEVPYGSPDLTISSQARDIRYIKKDIGNTKPKGEIILFTPIYLFANGLPVVLLAGMIFVRKRREKLSSNVGLARSKAASRVARKRLMKAKSLSKKETVEEFYLEISKTLTSYIADKLNLSAHGLTSDKIEEMLVLKDADKSLIADVKEVLQKSDFARYAPSSLSQEDIDSSLKKTEAVMIALEGIRFA